MLTALEETHLSWQCFGGEEDEYCGAINEAPLDSVVYRWGVRGKRLWAMIDLPPCPECGAVCSLKADYTLKELCRATHPVVNEHGIVWAYALPLRYVRNIRLHWLLYEQGRAEHAPVLPMPAQEALTHPQFTAIGNAEVVHALWFGFMAVRERTRAIESRETAVLQLKERGGI